MSARRPHVGRASFMAISLALVALLAMAPHTTGAATGACKMLTLHRGYKGALSQEEAVKYFESRVQQDETRSGGMFHFNPLDMITPKYKALNSPHSCDFSKLSVLRRQLSLLTTKEKVVSLLQRVMSGFKKLVTKKYTSQPTVVGQGDVKPELVLHELRAGAAKERSRDNAAEMLMVTGLNSFQNPDGTIIDKGCVRVDRARKSDLITIFAQRNSNYEARLMTCNNSRFPKLEFLAHVGREKKRMWFGHEGPGEDLTLGGRTDKQLGDEQDLAKVLNELAKNQGKEGAVIRYNGKDFTHPYELIDELGRLHHIESYYMIQSAFGVQGRQVAAVDHTGRVKGTRPFPPDRRLTDVVSGVVFLEDEGQPLHDNLYSPAYHTELKFHLTPKENVNMLISGKEPPVLFDVQLNAYQGHSFAGFYHKFYRAPNYLGAKVFGRTKDPDVSINRMKLVTAYADAMNQVSIIQQYPLHGYGTVGSCADLPSMVYLAEHGAHRDHPVVPPFFPMFTSADARVEIKAYLKCRYLYHSSPACLKGYWENAYFFDEMVKMKTILETPENLPSDAEVSRVFKNDVLKLLRAIEVQPSDSQDNVFAKVSRVERMAFSIPWPAPDTYLEPWGRTVLRVWSTTPTFYDSSQSFTIAEAEEPRGEMACPFPELELHLGAVRSAAMRAIMMPDRARGVTGHIDANLMGEIEYNMPNFDGTPPPGLTDSMGRQVTVVRLDNVQDMDHPPIDEMAYDGDDDSQ